MAKQISEANEDIGSNQNYRKQHNLQVIEIKKRIQKLEDAIIAPIIPSANCHRMGLSIP